MNYGYRYYSPRLGRWTCKDPIKERGGLNLYASADNSLVNHVDRLGLTKIDASTDCPDPLTVPVEKSYSGVSGTEYPVKTVTCECQEGADTSAGAKKGATCWSVVKCSIQFTALIKISFAEAREEGQAHWKIFGHEQRHIQSRCKRVEATVEGYIKQQDAGQQSSKETCETYKASIEKAAKDLLDKELDFERSPDHTGDRGASDLSPGNKEGYGPLPGTQGDYSRYAP